MKVTFEEYKRIVKEYMVENGAAEDVNLPDDYVKVGYKTFVANLKKFNTLKGIEIEEFNDGVTEASTEESNSN